MNTDRKTIDVQFLMEMPDSKSPNPQNVFKYLRYVFVLLSLCGHN